MADGSSVDTLAAIKAMIHLNDNSTNVSSPSQPFGAPPSAGSGPFGAPPPAGAPSGATTTYQTTQPQPRTPVPQVYTGNTTTITSTHNAGGPTGSGGYTAPEGSYTKDSTRKVEKLMDEFSKSSTKEQRKMALLLSLAGYAGSGSFADLVAGSFDMTLGDTLDAYNSLLMEAATRYVMHNQKVTPEDLLRKAIAYKMPAAAEWNGNLDTIPSALSKLGIKINGVDAEAALKGADLTGKHVGADAEARKQKPFVGTKTTISTSSATDIMDPADAKALTRAMLQRELGRDPTEEEFADFIGAIQHAQKVNPSVSRTKNSYRYEKDKYAPGGSRMVEQTSNTTTHSGITSEGIADIALQKARQNPNWAEWQAVGTYAPALFDALGATVPGR